MQRDHPEAVRGVQVCGHTAPAPGLPLITSLHTPPEVLLALHQALHHAMRAEALHAAREALLIQDFAELPLSDYEAITQMQARVNSASYRL